MQFSESRGVTAVGIENDYVSFVLNNQLKNRAKWKSFTKVFTTREDPSDDGWRGEFFGKMMRGASLVYAYTRDEELYGILTEAVEDLLKTQDEYGRISTYTVEHEFFGWDMWCRKYVLTGLFHYRAICKDEQLKERIVKACEKHLDYIISKIGKGKIEITETSLWWGCVNSCTILEPTIELYKITGKKKYLDFAEYIISTGGSSDCNFIELALEGKLYPYQYPVVKAYETMSFFEGLLAYYEVTGKEKYYEAVVKFYDAVRKTDMTAIGCSGCTHELFDNSSVRQTEYSEGIMQETCVTVTWMRLSTRLFMLTGDAKYVNGIEFSGLNALYGSLNLRGNKIWAYYDKEFMSGMTFDSYSPLYMNLRWRGVGGLKKFSFGDFGGCCEAIGACGVALMPLTAVMSDGDKVYVNLPFDGSYDVGGLAIDICGNYPSGGDFTVSVSGENKGGLSLYIRKPDWCEKMTVNGKAVSADGYYKFDGDLYNGNKISVKWERTLRVHRLNGKVGFSLGPVTLCADAEKSGDIKKPVTVSDRPEYEILAPEKGEIIRVNVKTDDGSLILTDYQSCGKGSGKDGIITVWLDDAKAQG